MFTGLIEEVGKVQQIIKGSQGWKLTIKASAVLDELKEGDSIAVDGACLTVTRIEAGSFQVDLSLESLQATYFQNLKVGWPVNLERALKLGDRLGGHFLLGHVDGVGVVKNLRRMNDFAELTVDVPAALRSFLVNKGSVSVNGVSLTVAKQENKSFSAALIPVTLKRTNLSKLKPGDKVNIETDILGKYVKSFLNQRFAKDDEEIKNLISRL